VFRVHAFVFIYAAAFHVKVFGLPSVSRLLQHPPIVIIIGIGIGIGIGIVGIVGIEMIGIQRSKGVDSIARRLERLFDIVFFILELDVVMNKL